MGEARTARILVIDDEPALARLVRRILEHRGWLTDVAGSGEEGLTYTAKQTYDVLVVDKNLPGIDGIEFIRTVRRSNKAVGVVMVTGYATADSALAAVELDVDGYVEKPFRSEGLIAIVELAMANNVRRTATGENLARAKQLARSVREPHPFAPAATKVLAAIGSTGPLSSLRERLATLDAEVVLVESSEEALERMAGEHFDLAIVDATSLNVVETVESLRTKNPETACVVVGRKPEVVVLKELISLQVTAFIEQGEPDGMLQRINAIVEGRARLGREPLSQ